MSDYFITTACILSARRHPAHPVSVPILPPRDTTYKLCGHETTPERFHTTLHIAQMLPAPGSKVNHFQEKYHSGTSYSEYFGLVYCCTSTPSISGLFTPEYCGYSQYLAVHYYGYFRTRSISGFDTVDTPCTSKHLRVMSVLRLLHVVDAFRPLVLRVLGVL